jgi:protein ImuB
MADPTLYACLYRPPDANGGSADGALAAIAHEFSPRFQVHRDDRVTIDVAGLTRLLGPAAAIGEALRQAIAARGIRVHIAVAPTQTAATILALARPGLTVTAPGGEAAAVAPVAIGMLEKIEPDPGTQRTRSNVDRTPAGTAAGAALAAFQRWGVNTLGDLAALPAADLLSRLGPRAIEWQALARGEDRRPLIPTLDEERFDAALDLEWPIEGREPLSFVLTRLLEPLATRLERRDRGAAVLHVVLGLAAVGADTPDEHARRLELPSPMRDVRALRTLALLDLESHPPPAPIDRVAIVIEPTPGRILQHGLFARVHPTPERISTLLARLGALMGQDRIGAPSTLDTYRPGAFAMQPFATDHDAGTRSATSDRTPHHAADAAASAFILPSALRRCRQPVPARVAAGADGRPQRVTTDRRGYGGGTVLQCAGPWRTSGAWWTEGAGGAGGEIPWNRDEWDVALSDGAIYRVFRDRACDAWFIDAIVD